MWKKASKDLGATERRNCSQWIPASW